MVKNTFLSFSILLGLALFATGCASDKSGANTGPTTAKAGQVPSLPKGVSLRRDNDIQGIWLSPGLNFTNYDTMYVADTEFKAVERSNEVKNRASAITSVQEKFVHALREAGLFKKVVMDTNGLAADGRTLKMYNTIIEFEKGGGAARYWAGLYGAGQPVIKVRGLVYDGDKLVFVFEARRSGESAGARVAGVFMSDIEIQENDIRDLTGDVANCMRRVSGLKDLNK
ncbi:MAG TPA: DUF4410 domain-containing protein [Desulfuromonadaceae bacterium]|nr:DUF4410 domain-containing protein [Desulfuromonadaceae bacterium]